MRRTKGMVCGLIVALTIGLVGCGTKTTGEVNGEETKPTQAVDVTEEVQPTEAAVPTMTPEPTATPLPERSAEYDDGDFSYVILNGESIEIVSYWGAETEIVIPETFKELPVTRLGANLFKGNQSITKVVIPDTVTTIGENAFFDCKNLADITLSSNITWVGYAAFDQTAWLANQTEPVILGTHYIFAGPETEVVVPEGIKTVSFSSTIYVTTTTWSFKSFEVVEKNNHVTSVVLPQSLERIDDHAFFQCKELEKIVIPNNIKSVGASAFSQCNALQEITFPASLTSIGAQAFYMCGNLQSVVFEGGLTETADNLFTGCTKLTKVKLPDTLKTITQFTFSTCTGLENLTIPNGVETIETGAFYFCIGLKRLTIPESVTNIREGSGVPFLDGYDMLIRTNKGIRVKEGSFAENYCKQKGLAYVYYED